MSTPHATFLRAICARPDLDLPRLVYADWLEGTAGQKPCPACPELGYGNEPEWTTEIPLYWCGQCDQATRSVPNGHAERAEFIRVQCELARLNDDSVMCHHPNAKPGDWCNDSDCLKCGRAAALRRREQLIGDADSPGYSFQLRNRDRWFHQTFPHDVFSPMTDFHGEFRRGFVEVITCSWPDFCQHADAIRAATPLRRAKLTTAQLWENGRTKFACAEQWGVYTHADYPGIEFELSPWHAVAPPAAP